MVRPCARSRHKFRSGSSWWKQIVLTWRPCPFAENAANQRIPESLPKPLPRRAAFHWKKFSKRQPKPRKSFLDSIDDDRWNAISSGTPSPSKGGERLTKARRRRRKIFNIAPGGRDPPCVFACHIRLGI